MDQKKIGAFIAQCRKEKNLTQIQLAEELGITNQAVSKWETGKGMPDMALLQPLCDILGIDLNELFSGQHLSEKEYKVKAEENISTLFKEKQLGKLKPVKYLFAICANVTLFVAAIELLIGIVGYFFEPIVFEVMLINMTVWVALFIPCVWKLMYDKNKLKKMKQSGICIEAEVEEILPLGWIRMGNYFSCKIECSFMYEDREYTAMSSCYILPPFKVKEDLHAYVYVDKENFGKYSVEILQE